tara:strand:+ start:956 stop:1171 length:216 start_codon:yes stop_codon:yes gene_type:complete
MNKPGYRFKLGDLVEFNVRSGAHKIRTGIVIERMFEMTRDDMYKINVEGKDYWAARPMLTLLSEATKASSK